MTGEGGWGDGVVPEKYSNIMVLDTPRFMLVSLPSQAVRWMQALACGSSAVGECSG